MPRKRTTAEKITVDAIKHKDKRVNIPTEELKGFVADDENSPKVMLYPRDPSLDPQLAWKGKDEQDREELAVPIVPIYIQEKIHPQTIIENVRAEATKGRPQQAALFNDFNGIGFEDLVDFYHHEQNWTNRMILGDSLQVMTSLAEKEGLKGKVQMIYIDPPYGIKFGSNWQVSTRKRNVRDGRVEDVTRQPEQVRAFRDTWELGIHSYLAYLRDRLTVARELLTDSGSIFVQIGDKNVHLVRCLLDEVFGSENFIAQITFKKTLPLGSSNIAGIADYIIFYAKNHEQVKFRPLYQPKPLGAGTGYTWVELPDGTRRKMTREERNDLEKLPKNSRPFFADNLLSSGFTESCFFEIELDGKVFPAQKYSWKTNRTGVERLKMARRLIAPAGLPNYVRFFDDFPVQVLHNIWDDTHGASDPTYVVQTSNKVVERCILMTTDPGDIVLDPTCGSGTTAYVAEQWGRRWITCDTSRVALALARTRLMSAKYPYYLLVDSPEGQKKESELTGQESSPQSFSYDVRKGFVYKRVPHITLKSIANNPDIREGMTREEIDAAIMRHADVEILYDQPYEDSSRIRVSGPFTVESLSPHRVVSSDTELPETEAIAKTDEVTSSFVTDILANLKAAGVSNTVKGEEIGFDILEPFAGEYIHAVGEFIEKGGALRRAAVSIGPEHGTVGSEYVREAAKEALKGAGFDLLLICGFAFDAFASETAQEFKPVEMSTNNGFAVAEGKRQFGKLPVLLVRMNPDLSMGPDLLKKTSKGQLFMIFGEPDVSITRTKNGRLIAELHGVDVYDPTTGEIRSHSTDDIACWFIDTAYNGESFFVRQAYFTGADEPYDKLKRALRSEIDEAAWSMLYQTVSQPFDIPETGRIAIKVINHYGDEVLKVFSVS
ncbi:site-specific DNA-methyltransferase [Alicyclobacillus suci]|uniref:site-specific DNA-methyltransferase n=1 Tax=Alicyclobacillus suci TaxID=2816080 RepID=UPI001A8D9A75|nr:site-specific DNA-methyltransferase [Alicyclobacillus suci]